VTALTVLSAIEPATAGRRRRRPHVVGSLSLHAWTAEAPLYHCFFASSLCFRLRLAPLSLTTIEHAHHHMSRPKAPPLRPSPLARGCSLSRQLQHRLELLPPPLSPTVRSLPSPIASDTPPASPPTHGEPHEPVVQLYLHLHRRRPPIHTAARNLLLPGCAAIDCCHW
jgi:hypothetical protein